MRKIWSRKDKDKRKSIGQSIGVNYGSNATNVLNSGDNLSINYNNGPTSNQSFDYDTSFNEDDTTLNTNQRQSFDNSSIVQVQNLVNPEYDNKLIKNQWLNVIVNSNSVPEISENTLKLSRVELKGSHLYLYKPPSILNVKSFKLDTNPSPIPPNSSTPAPSGPIDTLLPPASNNSAMPLTPSSSENFNDTQSPPPSHPLPPLPPSDIANDIPITYVSLVFPHPNFNLDNYSNSSPEALVHFFLFYNDSPPTPTATSPNSEKTPSSPSSHVSEQPVATTSSNPALNSLIVQLSNILPLYSNFVSIIKLISNYLSSINKFGKYNVANLTTRLLSLYNNVHDNFMGYLLNVDAFNCVFKTLSVLEELNANNETIKFLKSSLLNKHENLFNLINYSQISSSNNLLNTNINTNAAGSELVNPLLELNSFVFMNDLNLFELASVICSIDLKYFNQWNSNIDKSLLLLSNLDLHDYKKNPLIYNNDHHVHYLSKLLINHILLETNSFDKKARLLEKWIDLGCLLDKFGNMSSWLGISSIILSQPILRLTKIWSLVSQDYIKLLKNDWSPVLFELDRRHLASNRDDLNDFMIEKNDFKMVNNNSYHIMAPRGLGKIYPKERVIPYFGDLILNNSNLSNINELELIWKKINYSFNRWNDYLLNLKNFTEIIKYNEDVLKRYDNMGFIFSNESLNQVLYLGINNLNENDLKNFTNHSTNKPSHISNRNLEVKLLKLIEINSIDSMNLDRIMKLSISLEPELPESYLHDNSSLSNHSSAISLHSNDSTGSVDKVKEKEGNEPINKLPIFNNHYFKINLSKYDDLLTNSNNNTILTASFANSNKHNLMVDSDLVFRVDDFINDDSLSHNDDIEIDEEGLGIDVDDILNSEKFNNFSISSHEKREVSNSSNEANNTTNNGTTPGSNANSNPDSNFQKFIPKYASVDKLIDLLLIDAKYFDESIQIDLTEYRFVFLLNFNSFISTKELLDKLAHRFINSGNAVVSIMKKLYYQKRENQYPDELIEFPNWNIDNSVDLNELGDINYELLLKIQINILKVLIVLINNFYASFVNDLINKKILIKLLKLFSNEILQWYNSNKIDNNLEKSFENLVNYYKKLKKLFVKKTYRPIEVLKFDEYLIVEFKFNNSLHEVPMNRNLPGHKNINKIEKFLHKFNKLLTIFYKGIKAEDWFEIHKILENQFEKYSLLEFNLQKNSINDDNLIISNIFTFFDTLVDPVEKQLILKKFPLVFKKLFKLYGKFKTYLLIQLTDLNITVDERLDRMKTLLIMIKISKLKMADNQFIFEGDKDNIPSCIESAITNVIYSPESRAFTNLWMKAANGLQNYPNGSPAVTTSNTSYDSLSQLLPPNITHSDLIINHEPLLPCFGWIIENLIETNKCSNFYNHLINFNKRYLIYKLVKELSVEDIESADDSLTYHDTREFDFLLKLDESLTDSQHLKEFTALEKDKVKLFKSVLRDQHKILIVDNKKRLLRIAKEANVSHTIAYPNSATQQLNKKSSTSSLRRQSLSYKSNSSSRFKISGLFTKSRPFSLNVSGLSNTQTISSRELPNPDVHFEAKQKPFMVIPLKNKKIFPVYLLPLCFKIDSDSANDDFFFQAPSEFELNDWLIKLNYANRHWFFSRTINLKSNHNFTSFGIPIHVICNRDHSPYPRVLETIFREIETRGIKDVGIYRISSSITELTLIKSTIDKYGHYNFSDKIFDVHTLTSCVKSFFRELPDALLTDEVIDMFFSLKPQNSFQQIDEVEELNNYKEVLKNLPEVNFQTLKILLRHLQKICQYSEENRMTPSNIATVIGPALTEASNLDSLVNNFGFMNSILEKLILNYEYVFNEKSKKLENNILDDNTITGGATISESIIPENSQPRPVSVQIPSNVNVPPIGVLPTPINIPQSGKAPSASTSPVATTINVSPPTKLPPSITIPLVDAVTNPNTNPPSPPSKDNTAQNDGR